MAKFTDPRTGAILDVTVEEAVKLLAALPNAARTPEPRDQKRDVAEKPANAGQVHKPTTTRRNGEERNALALKFARTLRDAGTRGASGADLSGKLGIPARGLGGLKTALGGIAVDAGLRGVDDIVKTGKRLRAGGSLWKPGPAIGKAIDYLEGLAEPATNGTH